MLRSAASKVMWVGRATVFLVGLAVILALTIGVVSKATAHTGSAGLFHLGHSNAASALSSLVGTVSGGMLQVTNNSTATTATGVGVTNKSGVSPAVKATNSGGGPALGLNVGSGKAPMTVSSNAAKVTNLDADKVDGKEASSFANASHQHSGTDINSGPVEADFIEDGAGSNLNADQLDGLDSLAFVQGRGQVYYNRAEPPRDWNYRPLLEVPGFGRVGAACNVTSGNFLGFDNTSGGDLTMFKDDGGADPSYSVISNSAITNLLYMETGSELLILRLSRGTGANTRLATIAVASHYDSNTCMFEAQAIAHNS